MHDQIWSCYQYQSISHDSEPSLAVCFLFTGLQASSKQPEWRDWKRLSGNGDVSNSSCTPAEVCVLRIGVNSQSKVRHCFKEPQLTFTHCICAAAWCWCSYLSVEFKPADPQVHPREALVGSDGVNLNELVLPYGRAYRSVRLVVVQVKGFLKDKQDSMSAVCFFAAVTKWERVNATKSHYRWNWGGSLRHNEIGEKLINHCCTEMYNFLS